MTATFSPNFQSSKLIFLPSTSFHTPTQLLFSWRSKILSLGLLAITLSLLQDLLGQCNLLERMVCSICFITTKDTQITISKFLTPPGSFFLQEAILRWHTLCMVKCCCPVKLTTRFMPGCTILLHGFFIWKFYVWVGSSTNCSEQTCEADNFSVGSLSMTGD